MRVKKLVKVGLIVVGVLVVAGFLAFTTFVFNPFEGSVSDLRGVVPRNVDFFCAKKGLAGDFEDFPEPLFWTDIEGAPAFARVRAGSLYAAQARGAVGHALEEIRRVEAQLGEVPIIAPTLLGDVIGSDLAIAGRIVGGGARSLWCAYSRVSWKVRMACGLLAYDFVRSKLVGVRVIPDGELYRVEGNTPTPLWICCVKDVLIAGSDREFVEASRVLAGGGTSGDTLLAAAEYRDHVVSRLELWEDRSDEPANAVEFSVDIGRLRSEIPAFAAWPGSSEENLQEIRLLDAFVPLRALREVWGALVFQSDGVSLHGRVGMERGKLDDFQSRFLQERPGDVERWLRRFLKNVPREAAATGALRVAVGPYLNAVFTSLEPDLRQLINDTLRDTGQKNGFPAFVAKLAPAFEPWVGIVVRNNDLRKPIVKGKAAEIIVSQPSPAPVVAWIFSVRRGEEGRVTELQRFLKENRRAFGISIKKLRSGIANKDVILEYAHPEIPATGEIAMTEDPKSLGQYFMVSNSGMFLREIVNTRYATNNRRSVSDDPDLTAVLERLPRSVSGFFWVQGERIRDILYRYREFDRRRFASIAPDAAWAADVRPRVADELFGKHYAGRFRSRKQLPRAELDRLDELVRARLEALWSDERRRRGQAQEIGFSEAASYVEFLDKAYLLLRSGAKELSLEARAFVRW